MDQTDKTSKAPCSILFLWQVYTHGNLKSLCSGLEFSDSLRCCTRTQRHGRPVHPWLICSHLQLGLRPQEISQPGTQTVQSTPSTLSNKQLLPLPLIGPRGIIHLRSLSPQKTLQESLEGAQDHLGRELQGLVQKGVGQLWAAQSLVSLPHRRRRRHSFREVSLA